MLAKFIPDGSPIFKISLLLMKRVIAKRNTVAQCSNSIKSNNNKSLISLSPATAILCFSISNAAWQTLHGREWMFWNLSGSFRRLTKCQTESKQILRDIANSKQRLRRHVEHLESRILTLLWRDSDFFRMVILILATDYTVEFDCEQNISQHKSDIGKLWEPKLTDTWNHNI